MPKVRIRQTHPIMSKETLKEIRAYWGDEPITVYGYTQNGYFIVWDQHMANWGHLRIDYCVPCD